MTNTEIGSRIKYARNLKEATLDDVAQKVGVTKSTIQRYETGKIKAIKIPVIDSIAVALDVNPSWIVGKSEIMEPPNQKAPKIMQYYEQLNDAGKNVATDRVKELTEIPRYTKEEVPDYLKPQAAHNDNQSEDQLAKMRKDMAKLKRPE